VVAQEPDKPENVITTVTVEEKPTPVAEAPATEPFRLGSARDYSLLTKVHVRNSGEDTATNVRLEIPLLASSSSYQTMLNEHFSLVPTEIKIYQGARTGVFSLGDIAPGGEITLELRYTIRTSTINYLESFIAQAGGDIPVQYLGAGKGIESDHEQIISLAGKLTQSQDSDWEKAKAITQWVAANISYDANATNRNSGALQALQTRKGVCEDYATLSAALARAAGIPARIAYGYTDNGTNWPASGSFSLRGFRHAWVEFYLEGRGWVPAEPTRSRTTLYFGTLPHNRYIIQNYNDISLKGNYRGGKLAISWTDSLE
jgi:transglutaminase-like putative cysteine protease